MNKEHNQKIINYLEKQIIDSYITHSLPSPDDAEIKKQAQNHFLQLSEEEKTEILNKINDV